MSQSIIIAKKMVGMFNQKWSQTRDLFQHIYRQDCFEFKRSFFSSWINLFSPLQITPTSNQNINLSSNNFHVFRPARSNYPLYSKEVKNKKSSAKVNCVQHPTHKKEEEEEEMQQIHNRNIIRQNSKLENLVIPIRNGNEWEREKGVLGDVPDSAAAEEGAGIRFLIHGRRLALVIPRRRRWSQEKRGRGGDRTSSSSSLNGQHTALPVPRKRQRFRFPPRCLRSFHE